MKYVIGFLTALLMMGAVSIYNNRLSTPEDYMLASIQEASKRLDTFVKHEQLNRSDFTGLYVEKTDNPEPPTFITCYKSKTHYFCHHHGIRGLDYGGHFDKDCTDNFCQWLKSQP